MLFMQWHEGSVGGKAHTKPRTESGDMFRWTPLGNLARLSALLSVVQLLFCLTQHRSRTLNLQLLGQGFARHRSGKNVFQRVAPYIAS